MPNNQANQHKEESSASAGKPGTDPQHVPNTGAQGTDPQKVTSPPAKGEEAGAEFSKKPPKTVPAVAPLPAASSGAGKGTLAMQVFEEQNLARTKPKEYAAKLKKCLSYFKGSTMYFPGNPVGLMTNEGPGGYANAIAFLEGHAPMTPLKWSEGLGKSANDHAKDIGGKGITGHTGSDGSSMTDRMDRYGKWQSKCGENCSFGCATAEDIICQLIVDDGLSSRGHRNNIFSSDFGVTGVAYAPHKSQEHCCVLDYAGGFTDK